MPKGSVIIQDPVAGSHVKRYRKIYLTTVTVLPEKVLMPDLIDLSLRQATATLETYGLKLDQAEAIEWFRTRGSRSGRVAWQYVQHIAGRQRKKIAQSPIA